MSSAIKTPAFQAKAGNITNEDGSSIYSNGDWSLKNSTAVASVTIKDDGAVTLGPSGFTGSHVVNGNVGIGTSSPAGKTYIAGPNTANLGVAASNALNLAATGGALVGRRVNLGFAVVDSAVNNAASITFEYTDQSNFGKGDLLFATRSVNTDTAPTERMRLDASGRLLVGTTNAVAKHVVYGSGTVQWIELNGVSGTLVQFRNSQAAGGNITIAAGGGTSYNTAPSDYRLKEQVQDLGGGLEKVKQLRPVSFKWKESGKEDFGFIAHEIASVIPECVTGDKDAVDAEGKPEYQSIFPAPAQMIASLVAAIQEQQAQIEELKAKVSALEAK